MTNDLFSCWGQAFRILSLDYVLPLWEYIGLVFPNEIRLQVRSFMRDGYIQEQKIISCESQIWTKQLIEQEQEQEQEMARREFKIQKSQIQTKQLIESVLNNVETRIGKNIATQLNTFCDRYITTYNRDAEIVIEKWRKEIIGLYYRSLALVKEPNVLSWDEERYAELAKFIEDELVIPDEKIEELIKQFENNVDETICSEWDKMIFTREREEFMDLNILFVLIQNIGENYNWFRFWVRLKKEFTETEVNSVVKWTKDQIGEQSIPWFIPPL